MKTNENKSIKTEIVLDRTRSMDSTTIMANTVESRQKKVIRIPIISSAEKKKLERALLLDRLTIVNVETSSTTKKKKGRRESAPRNHKPLPEELLFPHGQPDSVSMIPDSFSNAFSKDEEADKKMAINEVPRLFTFDLVPSFSEDSLCKEIEENSNTDNDTTYANIGEEEDDISEIFDEFEKSDDTYAKDVEKYGSNKNTTDTNMETITALSKLELTSRIRTDSTANLSEMSSNDMSSELAIFEPSKPKQGLNDEASFVAHDELYVKASRCISLNMFSMFD